MIKNNFNLVSKIDLNDKPLVNNLISYIKEISDDCILKKVYKNSEDCLKYLYNYIKIDRNAPTFTIDDISFLSDNQFIVGYVISRIIKEKDKDIVVKVIECDIPDKYNLSELLSEYLKNRTKGIQLNEEIYQK